MKYRLILFFAGLFCAAAADAQVTRDTIPRVFTRIDSTLKIGKVGYRVTCRNKYAEFNDLTVRPVGFDGGARDIAFPLRGRVLKAQIDDLNSDGNPDLVLFIVSDTGGVFGTVYAFLSVDNKSI